MRLATIRKNGVETAAIIDEFGALPVDILNRKLHKNWSTELLELIRSNQFNEMKEWYRNDGEKFLGSVANEFIPKENIQYGPLYRHPRKIWGIGLNYVEHASDLSEETPKTEPASFMKPDTTIIGPEDTI